MDAIEISNTLLSYLKQNHYHVYNQEPEDLNEFLQDEKDYDSTYHSLFFKLREIPGWQFGTDFVKDTSTEKWEIHFFCNIKDCDKFKSSRAIFKQTFYEKDIVENINHYYKMKQILKTIQRHPIISFCMADAQSLTPYGKSFFKDMMNTKFSKIKYDLKIWFRDVKTVVQHKWKVIVLKQYKIVKDAKFFDMQEPGTKCSPRYRFTIYFNNFYGTCYTDQEDQCNSEVALFNKFFKKRHYANMNIDLWRDNDEEMAGPYYYAE